MKKMFAILGFLVMLFVIIFAFLVKYNIIRQVNISESEEKQIGYVNPCFNEIPVIQWGFNGNENFFNETTVEYIDSESWETDERRGNKNICISLNKAKEHQKIKRNAVIAIIDSEVDYTQEIMKQHLWINDDEVPADGIDNDSNGYVDDVFGWNFREDNNQIYNDFYSGIHGTHIMGILCAEDSQKEYYGILANNPTKVMCLKALSGRTGKGKIKDVVEAINYAEKEGANICMLSLATKENSKQLKNVILNSKMLFIVAAGNDGMELDNSSEIYPASFDLDNKITVAAIRCDGKLSKKSNYGKELVDIAAPGVDIVSTLPEGQYSYLSGTSIAVPFVAGVAAMIYENSEKLLSAEEIKNKIIKTAKKSIELKPYIKSGGIVNAYRALRDK